MNADELNVSEVLADLERFYADHEPAAGACGLNFEGRVSLHLLLWQLGRARTDAAAHAVILKIRDLVGLPGDDEAFLEATNQRYAGVLL